MRSLWFVMPAHGRHELARICMRQLRRTCDQLERNGVRASAVVIADDDNLDTARALGFAWAERNNRFLGRRFNDGIHLACDREYNRHPVDYVVPIGSDDWVDWRLFVDLPARDVMVGFRSLAFVDETGSQLAAHRLDYEGGCGIRIYPRRMMGRLEYRPCDEYRTRGCDTSILVNLRRAGALKWVEHRDTDPLQIVDWKSPGEQVTPYTDVAARHKTLFTGDPFELLAGQFPDVALDEMRAHYAPQAVAA